MNFPALKTKVKGVKNKTFYLGLGKK